MQAGVDAGGRARRGSCEGAGRLPSHLTLRQPERRMRWRGIAGAARQWGGAGRCRGRGRARPASRCRGRLEQLATKLVDGAGQAAAWSAAVSQDDRSQVAGRARSEAAPAWMEQAEAASRGAEEAGAGSASGGG